MSSEAAPPNARCPCPAAGQNTPARGAGGRAGRAACVVHECLPQFSADEADTLFATAHASSTACDSHAVRDDCEQSRGVQ
eukprot:8062556-Alexandrium_andersonii.AAC.1